MNKILIYSILASCLFFSCTNPQKDPDVSNVPIKIIIHRLDKDLFSANIDNPEQSIIHLKAKYGKFFNLYNQKIVEIGNPDNKAYPEYLKRFLTDYSMNQSFNKCLQVFPDSSFIALKLTDAFKHYRYYFPDKQIPAIYTYISGFNQSIVIDQDILGIGLDRYLGEDCIFYKQLQTNNYERYNMHKEKIPSDCMKSMALTEWVFNDSVDNLLNNMIYQGQVMYFVKKMLPNEPDTLIWGISRKQYKWCEKNEKRMWTYLVEQKLLFANASLTISKFINDGPFTKDFTRESPARAAVWLGYRIVDKYMKNNPKLTLKNLMQDQDYQKILTLSEYEP
jgi:hypothetical protein